VSSKLAIVRGPLVRLAWAQMVIALAQQPWIRLTDALQLGQAKR
jgi:hypothetical protein